MGGQKPIEKQLAEENTKITPFVAVSIKYSFDMHAARVAAAEVGRDTKRLIATKQLGYVQIVVRRREEVRKLLEVENSNQSAELLTIASLRRLRTPLVGIDLILASNALRPVDIRLKAAQAELTGSGIRSLAFLKLREKLN